MRNDGRKEFDNCDNREKFWTRSVRKFRRLSLARINITIDDLDHRHDGRIRSRAITTDTRPLQTIYGPSP